jgi:hypothetical protein
MVIVYLYYSSFRTAIDIISDRTCNFLYLSTSVYYLSYAATLLVIIGIVSILPTNIQ